MVIVETAVNQLNTFPVVDHAFFARHTLDDSALQAELVQLFSKCAVQYYEALSQDPSAHDWYMAAHALKGAAQNVGAVALAALCERAEAGYSDENRELLLQEIGGAMSAALHELANRFGGDSPLADR